MQHGFNAEILAGTNPHVRMRTPDDSVRFQSTVYAFVRVLDKIVLLARTVRPSFTETGSWASHSVRPES